jgi:hypothetical protein
LLLEAKPNTINKVSTSFRTEPPVQPKGAKTRPAEPFFEDFRMNKLLVALFATAFGFFSISAMADDSDIKPLSKMQTDEAKAAREAAKAKWDKMTPDQQAAAKKAARQKRLADANALDMIANENMMYNTQAGAAATAASKDVAKPTKEQRQKDLTEQAKKSSGQ